MCRNGGCLGRGAVEAREPHGVLASARPHILGALALMRESALTIGEAFAAFKNSPRRRKVSAKCLGGGYEKILAELALRFFLGAC